MYQLACFHFCVHPVWQLSPGPVFNLFLVFLLVWFISHLPTFNLLFYPSAPLLAPLLVSFLLFSFLLHCHSFSLVVFTFLLSPSLTLIRRRRYGSALWDWRKEGLIPYLNVCVCVCVWVDVCIYVSSFVHACMHTPLLVWNREILVWIYKRIQWCGVEFSFLSLQKEDTVARRRQGKFAFLFRAVWLPPTPTPPKHTVTNTSPAGEEECEWCMELSSVGFCALVSGSMRAVAGAGGGGLTAGSQMILLILLTLLFLSSTASLSLPRSLHPFLPPFISRAVEITCPLARAHHQSHDSLRIATVMAAALIESRGRVRLCLCLDTVVCAWEMTSEWKVYFFNLLKAPCLCALHL